MNESFEVILNHEEFQNYKLLQKNSDLSDKALRELRRDIENYKLKCEQQQLAVRTHQLKIKELSKNSIRLSRRLVVEQEEHFNTQEAFLTREKQLLEKLLTLSNDHENMTVSLLSARDAKEKLESDNVALKRKISEQDKQIESLGLELRQAKKQQVSLSDRCKLAEGEFLTVSKEFRGLKVQMEQLSLETQRSISKMQERLQASQKTQQDKIAETRQVYQEEIRLAQLKHYQLLQEKAAQIQELNIKLHQKMENFNTLQSQKAILQDNFNGLLLLNRGIITKLNHLMVSIQILKKDMEVDKQDIQLKFWDLNLLAKTKEDAFNSKIKQFQVAQNKKKQTQFNISNRQKLLDVIWKHLSFELDIILKQLRNDKIMEEEQIILTLQFSRSVCQLKLQLDKKLTEYFNSWLKQ